MHFKIGKTTFLNAVGNAVILAHIGCFLPASYAAIPIFDRILTHRSSGDSILNGTSCFMSDMLDVVRVLKTATSNSLVLMDELGVGTSTNTGIGIAIAVISRLVAEIECTVLCSTHFREIGIRIVREVEKMLKSSPGSLDADQFTRSRNFHVDVEESKSKVEGERSTKLLYRVVPGPLEQTGSSFAIEVAKSYSGLPAELIDDANAILAREEMILCPSR